VAMLFDLKTKKREEDFSREWSPGREFTKILREIFSKIGFQAGMLMELA
jgi:hypothetical protein